jgi:hypothetical protein
VKNKSMKNRRCLREEQHKIIRHFRLENMPVCVRNNKEVKRYRAGKFTSLVIGKGRNGRKKVYPVDGNSSRRWLSM